MFRLFLTLLIISNSLLAQHNNGADFKLHKFNGSVTDFTPHGTQNLLFGIIDAANCSDCHTGFTPADQTFTPAATWSGSMMANAARDPLFWAAVDVANNDVPGIGDFCIRCHTPSAFYKGHTKDGTGDLSYANGCQLTGTASQQIDTDKNDFQGVNCHFCHRQEPKGPNNESLITNNANSWIDDEVCNNPMLEFPFGPCRKGPYDDYNSTTGFAQPPHDWKYSPFVKSGDFCGTCHNVSSPEIMTSSGLQIAKTLIDQNGINTGVAFPIERTYSEWKNSLFPKLIFTNGFESNQLINKGATCQDCHMPEANDLDSRVCVQTPPGRRSGNLKKHEFAGGNSWMPQVIKSIYGSSLGREDAFDRTTAKSLEMLINNSAIIETTIISSNTSQIQAKVKVTNLTGHKLPTGYPEGRRMWINLVVKDATNLMIYESGAYNLSTAILTEDTDIKIYETLQGVWDIMSSNCVVEVLGKKVFHFALNNCVKKDNRIPPLGFISTLETQPVAAIYSIDPNNPNALVNFDETIYSVNLPSNITYPLSITSTLKYQTSSKEYIEFLDDESTANNILTEDELCGINQATAASTQSRAAYMKTLWENNGKSAPVDMVSSTLKVN